LWKISLDSFEEIVDCFENKAVFIVYIPNSVENLVDVEYNKDINNQISSMG